MKSMKLKTKEIADAYKLLKTAKYSKMSEEGLVRVWKIERQLKSVAIKYEEDKTDAQKRLITDEEFPLKLQKAQQYVLMKKEGKTDLPMTAAEFAAVDEQYGKYTKLLNEALKEFAEEEKEIEFNPLSEEEFGKLMASNDWTLEQVDPLEFIVK